MHVYAQTHPWIQASRWVYENVPNNAVIAVEHWDDHLPLSLPGGQTTPGQHGYRHVELPMYEPDTPDKLWLIRDRLREADLIVLSTNRLYRTIPRLPERRAVDRGGDDVALLGADLFSRGQIAGAADALPVYLRDQVVRAPG